MSNDEQHVIHKEIAALQDEVRLLRGALRAQDDRERQAGKLCGVPYEESGCDWPCTVAEELVLVRQQLEDYKEKLAGTVRALTLEEEQVAIEQQRLTTAAALLARAAGSLNAYCEELNGDLNDSLATEIELFLGTKESC